MEVGRIQGAFTYDGDSVQAGFEVLRRRLEYRSVAFQAVLTLEIGRSGEARARLVPRPQDVARSSKSDRVPKNQESSCR